MDGSGNRKGFVHVQSAMAGLVRFGAPYRCQKRVFVEYCAFVASAAEMYEERKHGAVVYLHTNPPRSPNAMLDVLNAM